MRGYHVVPLGSSVWMVNVLDPIHNYSGYFGYAMAKSTKCR
ncbi:hypothetical protein SBF1_950002 [Candidatus Desulfosporosinus infrequens]|uniref:Uncharacterized protein n=1 Tax=Candidatus Desulfosporosinus infrequens TaxID=2043169 RepID=A0A2U3LXR5_9FIRM|nr:hypothetical protein SBF1_950002 [Candidatus Desulfosporosinus infrequens]